MLWALGGAPLLLGCPRNIEIRSLARLQPEDLSADPVELARLADELEARGDAASLEDALVVRTKILTLASSYDAAWRLARAAFVIADDAVGDAARQRRAKFANLGIDHARKAIALDGRGVEGPYYLAINLGLLASTKTLGAVEILPEMLKHGKRAAEIDPKFDHAGPLRLIGALLIKAPGWPASVGDPEEGGEHLARAVELAPEYPENHLFFCEALLANDKVVEAQKECAAVLAAPLDPAWERRLPRWRAEAEHLGAKIRKRLGG